MAQEHLASGEMGSVLPLGDKLTDATTQALFKASQLMVSRLVLAAGKSIPEHVVPGEITVQCLEGVIDFRFGRTTRRMRQGDFLRLDGGISHELTALEDASVLLTICLLPTSGD